jgi:hypothetical protein
MTLRRGLLALLLALVGAGVGEVCARAGEPLDGDVRVVITCQIVTQHTITATAGVGGTIAPAGAVSVNDGDDQTFTIAPAAGYIIADVLVDGATVGAVAAYTFNNVAADHTIAATFTMTNQLPVAYDQALTVRQGSKLKITLSGSDPDGDPLAYTLLTRPQYGKLTGSGRQWTYTPKKGYLGQVWFTFRVSDGKGGQDTGTVTINVVKKAKAKASVTGLRRHWVRRRAR